MRLRAADPGTRTRALERLQRVRGNGYVQGVVRAILVGRFGGTRQAGVGAGLSRTRSVTLERSAHDAACWPAIQREEAEATNEGATELNASLTGASEVIGPTVSSFYSLTAVSLSGAAAQLSMRPEAGHVDWALDMKYAAPKGPIETVAITAAITLEMPSWTPPTTMLPKARAEWNRWYAALLAHEQGHIDLVHANFDELAQRMLGKSAAAGKKLFNAASAKLTADSKAYDKSTDHGKNNGTVMEVSIEEKELQEEKDKKKAADETQSDKSQSTERVPASP